MNPQKNKGDRAEREACIYLTAATGHIVERRIGAGQDKDKGCLLYTSPSPRDLSTSRMPSSA